MPPPDIERIERDIAFQQRFWMAERVGWVAMAGLVGLALLGLLGGGGPLASAERRIGEATVSWARIQRLGSTTPLRIALPAGEAAEPRLPPDFASRWRLRDGMAGMAGDHLALHVEPIGAPGPRRLRIEIAGRMLDLPVFVWP
jgi:hypothetical protein